MSPREVAVARYDLSCRIRPTEPRLDVEGTIELPPATEERASLRFTLRGDMRDVEIQVLEPEPCAGRAELSAGPLDPKNTDEPQRSWELRAPQPFPAGRAVKLSVRYGGGDSVSLNFHIHPHGSYAHSGTAWYPRFDLLHAVGTVRYTVPDPWVVKASGALLGKDSGDGELVYRFECRAPTGLGFVAAPFTVIRRQEGRIPMEVYLLRDRPFLDEMVRKSFDALPVLEREFGPYPFPDFAIVEVPSEPALRSGFSGAAYEGYYLVRTDLLDAKGFEIQVFGHEMGHQWFPLLVANYGNYMLGEALAQYGGLRCVEAIEGAEAAERSRRAWADGAARCIASGFDYPLGALPNEDAGAYELSDTKGVLVYDLLSRTIGRDNFRRALHAVTSRHAYGKIAWDEWLSAIQSSSELDLDEFNSQWFERLDMPSLSHRWMQSGDALELTIEQSGPHYRLSVPISIQLEDGSALRRNVDVSGPKSEFRIPVPMRVREVELDPDATLPLVDAKSREKFAAQRDYLRGDLLWNQNKTDEALSIFREGLTRVPQLDKYGVEFLLRLSIGWIAQEAESFTEAREEYERALSLAVRDDVLVAQLYWNLAETCRALGDIERARWAALNVLDAEAAREKESWLSGKARDLLQTSGR